MRNGTSRCTPALLIRWLSAEMVPVDTRLSQGWWLYARGSGSPALVRLAQQQAIWAVHISGAREGRGEGRDRPQCRRVAPGLGALAHGGRGCGAVRAGAR